MELLSFFLKWLITFIRASVRPVVTVVLVLTTFLLAKTGLEVFATMANKGILDASQILVILTMIFEFIFAIVVAVIAFWFGTRTQDKKTEPPVESQ